MDRDCGAVFNLRAHIPSFFGRYKSQHSTLCKRYVPYIMRLSISKRLGTRQCSQSVLKCLSGIHILRLYIHLIFYVFVVC